MSYYKNVPAPTVEQRFWSKVAFPETDSGCWEWTAFRKTTGYGTFARSGSCETRAHRIAWLLLVGRIPDGLDLLHVCDNPPCVRPEHLWLGTHADNMADMVAKGRAQHGHGFKKRPTCARSHAWTPENTWIVNHGKSRRCLTCYQANHPASSIQIRPDSIGDVDARQLECDGREFSPGVRVTSPAPEPPGADRGQQAVVSGEGAEGS